MPRVKSEYLFIAAVILIILSASRMSQIGNALGKFVYSFKKAKDGEGFVDSKTVSLRGGGRDAVVDAEIVDDKKPHS
ncbi:MAG: twin-arginine translocase TatA/TatE family subunit [Myxococcaceae bacterium]|nr:twin-arginine translocase TatA/TatE family subunit [Myxococcaceae bacterium]